jgi:transcription elongation factor GreA
MELEARKKIEEEVKTLGKELKTELPRALKIAVAMGDLSENAEYHAAKERQDFVQARLSQLRKRLSDLSMINFDKIPRDRISLGSTVKLYDVDNQEEITYKLVTTEEANLFEGAISTTSPIGRGLLGKQDGDSVSVKIPAGARSFEVISFTTIHDD